MARISRTRADSGCNRRPQKPDHEVVVVAVQAVARKPHIGGEPRLAVAPADAAVFAEDRALPLVGQPVERLAALQGIPDCPAQVRIEDPTPRAVEEHVFKVSFVADGVGPPEHVVFRLVCHDAERPVVETFAQRRDEDRGILGEHDDSDALGIVDVPIDRTLEPGPGERPGGFRRGTLECRELHEQTPVEGDRLSLPTALLAQIGKALFLTHGATSLCTASTSASMLLSGVSGSRP